MSKRQAICGASHTAHLLSSPDAFAFTCSFLDPRELANVMGVSRRTRAALSGRVWVANALQRPLKERWCKEREATFAGWWENRFDPGAEAASLQKDVFPTVTAELLRLDQSEFIHQALPGKISRMAIPLPLHLLALRVNPFASYVPEIARQYPEESKRSDMIEMEIIEMESILIQMVKDRLGATRHTILAQVDRLPLVKFQRMWGSVAGGEVSAEQAFADRKTRLGWIGIMCEF